MKIIIQRREKNKKRVDQKERRKNESDYCNTKVICNPRTS